MKDKIDILNQLRAKAELGGGEARIKAQHDKGKNTARERINLLLDENSFIEIDRFTSNSDNAIPGDSVIVGTGTINGKNICVYSQDFTVMGGSLSKVAADKICKIMDIAISTGCPMIGIIDSGGARIQEGVHSLVGYGSIFTKNVRSSGVIPQISIIVGPSAGGATYSPAITDFIFMVKDMGQMYITGPDVVKQVTGENTTHEELGGSESHMTKSGVCHFIYNDETDCFNNVKKLLNYLPQNNQELVQNIENSEPEAKENLSDILPENSNTPYDMNLIIKNILDKNSFMEVQENYAKNIIIGFGKIGGKNIGLIAQQPNHLAGVIDIKASEKAARFIRFCDAFNIPIISLVDVPGFLPGLDQEHNGIIRRGAKLLYAYAEATVPKISIIIRKAYGGAYIVMSSKSLLSDLNYAWPSAEVAVMGPEAAIKILYRKELKSSNNSKKLEKELLEKYKKEVMTPYTLAENGYIEDLILPEETRKTIINSLKILENKRELLPPKKHGNIPL
jgi:acetyl-CoA carboxylase carboxyltransferase component|tara:strand:+ start:1165 stop:2682 length:1518 start_codon:yes stop_codon:yes gene_type:complete